MFLIRSTGPAFASWSNMAPESEPLPARSSDELRPDASLIAIELNLDFVTFLRESLPDPRLRVLHGSAVDVCNLLQPMKLCQADCILSGIPYTVLPRETRRHIFLETRQVLSRDGLFVVYQYTRAVLPAFQKLFLRSISTFEPLNILPARSFRSRKQSPYFSAPTL